jgi:uncharacterized protein (TIGR02996 family)
MLESLLQAIVEDPQTETRWLVLADWLEEHDDPRRAELLRLHRRLLGTCCEPEKHPERAAWQTRMVELLGQGVRPCVPQKEVTLAEGVEMVFSFIPPGSFLMGSPAGEGPLPDSERPHRVTLTRGYWLGTCPVTQAQWQAVTGGNPSRFKAKGRPVERVTWDDCRQFCGLAARRTGFPFRPPTEAEWERACRSGTTTPFFFGGTISTDLANYNGGHVYGKGPKGVFRNRTTLPGTFPPNAWGLYDTHGNVWEWCSDWYGPYPQAEIKDPLSPDTGGTRVQRGGCWRAYPVACRSASRWHINPGYRTGGLCGFWACLGRD